MQPGANPDDLHTILSRFHTWAEKQPANGSGHRNGAAGEGIRELTYEEAIARHRARDGGARARRTRMADKPGEAPTAAKAETAPDAIAAGAEGRPVMEARLETQREADARPRTEWVDAMEYREYPGRGEEEILRMSPQEELPFAGGKRDGGGGPAPDPVVQGRKPAETTGFAAPDPVREPKTRARSKHVAVKPAAHPGRMDTVATVGRAAAIADTTLENTNRAAGAAGSKAVAPSARAVPRKTAARAREEPEFRQVLAKTVRIAKKASPAKQAGPWKRPAVATKKQAAPVKKQREPERKRRITTRFSGAEERRVEKAAAAAGLSVSAWLRRCALAAERGTEVREKARVSAIKAPRRGSTNVETNVPAQLFAQPANSSLVGGWLALLRQRFLGSPARFAERA